MGRHRSVMINNHLFHECITSLDPLVPTLIEEPTLTQDKRYSTQIKRCTSPYCVCS